MNHLKHLAWGLPLLTLTLPAHAYINTEGTSLVWQTLLAGGAGIAVLFRYGLLLLRRHMNPQTVESNTAQETTTDDNDHPQRNPI